MLGEAVERLCNYELQCYENPIKNVIKNPGMHFSGP